MQLCHHFAPAMVERGSGGIVILGSGAGFAGGPNMVAYAATKAFDMVFAEALWAELHDKGVDVLGLILGKTDTPALRRLEHSRGLIGSPDETPPDAAAVVDVIAEAFDNMGNGPTWIVGEKCNSSPRPAPPRWAAISNAAGALTRQHSHGARKSSECVQVRMGAIELSRPAGTGKRAVVELFGQIGQHLADRGVSVE
jgi:NAD(P)-dependent dehydrogenase (short-subunit alcohol dehydrogenase family)